MVQGLSTIVFINVCVQFYSTERWYPNFSIYTFNATTPQQLFALHHLRSTSSGVFFWRGLSRTGVLNEALMTNVTYAYWQNYFLQHGIHMMKTKDNVTIKMTNEKHNSPREESSINKANHSKNTGLTARREKRPSQKGKTARKKTGGCDLYEIGKINTTLLSFYTRFFYSLEFDPGNMTLRLSQTESSCQGNSLLELSGTLSTFNDVDLWCFEKLGNGYIIRNKKYFNAIVFLEKQPRSDKYLAVLLRDEIKIAECLNSSVRWKCVFQLEVSNNKVYFRNEYMQLGIIAWKNNKMVLGLPARLSKFVPNTRNLKITEEVIEYELDLGGGLGGLKSGIVETGVVTSDADVTSFVELELAITYESKVSIMFERMEESGHTFGASIDVPLPKNLSKQVAPKITAGLAFKDIQTSKSGATWINSKTHRMKSRLTIPGYTDVKYAFMLTYQKNPHGSFKATVLCGATTDALCYTRGSYGIITRQLPVEILDRLHSLHLLGRNIIPDSISREKYYYKLRRQGSYSASVGLGIYVEAYDLYTDFDQQRPLPAACEEPVNM